MDWRKTLLRIITWLAFPAVVVIGLNIENVAHQRGWDQFLDRNWRWIVTVTVGLCWAIVGAAFVLWINRRSSASRSGVRASVAPENLVAIDVTADTSARDNLRDIRLKWQFKNTGRAPIVMTILSASLDVNGQKPSPEKAASYSNYLAAGESSIIRMPSARLPEFDIKGWAELKILVAPVDGKPVGGVHIGCEFVVPDIEIDLLGKRGLQNIIELEHTFTRPFYASPEEIRQAAALRRQ